MAELPIVLQELIDYLNCNRHLLEHCYNRYSVEGLMLMLDSAKLQRLEKEFKLYPSGLELPVFLFTMREILQESCRDQDRYDLVDGLVSLFQSIDIDGDGHLLWQQFTEYIIEAIKKLDRPALHHQQRQLIEAAYSKLGRQYKMERTAQLNLSNTIRKLMFVEQLNGFLSLESNSTMLKVYGMDFSVKETLQFPASKWYYYLQDFAVDVEGMMLAALLPDGAYFLPLKYRPGRCVLPCRDLQLINFSSVWWLPDHRYWAFGSSTGELKICSVLNRSRSAVECSVIFNKRHHNETMTMLKEISQPDMLCSCSLDGTVKLLSLNSLKIFVLDELEKKNGPQSRGKRGYLGFDYSCEFGRVVMLYGFSNSITLHSLDLSLTKGFAGRYCEHSVSIRHARFIRGNQLAVSIDERCCLRIWNYRTLRTHQIIDGDRLFSSQCELLVVPQIDSFYIAERKITEFKSVSFFKRAKEINHRPLDFHYNSYLGSFWMFTNSDARHYDSLNGRLKQLLTNLSEPKCQFVVTAAEFGPQCRKLYIGDAGGFLREYSAETGEFIQELRPLEDLKEYQQVRKIIYVKEEDLVLCASIDGRILVFFRNESNEYVLVRDLRGSHTTDLTGMCYSEEYHLMASSCEGGTINLWNSVKYMLETVLTAGDKVIDVRFVKGYPVLLACCQLGEILCFGVRPMEQTKRHRCIFKVTNQLTLYEPLTQLTCFDATTKKGNLQCDIGNATMHNLLNVDTNHVLACIGDATGTAATLCLDLPFSQLGIVWTERIDLEEPSHPRRYDHCYIDKQVQSFLSRKCAAEGRSNCPVFVLTDVKIASWEAHQSPLLKIKFQRQPFVLMTGGDDQKFKIFDLSGKVCGIVNCETFKSTLWKMPEVNIKRRLKQIDFVLYILNLIDGVSLSESEQAAVKSRMLMERYMDETDKQLFLQHIKSLRHSRQSSGITSAVLTPARISEALLHQNPTFKENYDRTILNLKERLLSVDKEIAANRMECRQSTPMLTTGPFSEKRKLTQPKQIRSLKAKLEAIEQHLPTTSQPRQQPINKEKKPLGKHKSCLFVSYGQLKRNLTAMHKMLRINNIR